MSESDWNQVGFHLGTVFNPTRPINREDLFKGRTDQRRAIVDTINQPGLHAILFGERGVGKTSLANMIFPMLSSVGRPLLLVQINCMSADTFSDMWHRVLLEIHYKIEDDKTFEEVPDEAQGILLAAKKYPLEVITSDAVRRLLTLLGRDHIVIIVIDEFDIVQDEAAKKTIAEMIKFLSDRNTPATIILIGIADDIEQLISDHRSVERCLCQIHMPRMSRNELESVAVAGLGTCTPVMSMKRSALHELSRLSKGLPHYMHLLTLHAARAAVDAGSLVVDESQVREGIKKAIDLTQSSLKTDYVEAISSARRDAKFKEVLTACALANTDELGFFFPVDIKPTFPRIMKMECSVEAFTKHLVAFCEDRKRSVLSKDERLGRTRYRFTNPLLQPYVLLRGLSDGIISEDDLKETRDRNDKQGRLF